MTSKFTHFKYVCRVCQKEHLQPVLPDEPEKTPIPRCCGRARDMAYQGPIQAPTTEEVFERWNSTHPPVPV